MSLPRVLPVERGGAGEQYRSVGESGQRAGGAGLSNLSRFGHVQLTVWRKQSREPLYKTPRPLTTSWDIMRVLITSAGVPCKEGGQSRDKSESQDGQKGVCCECACGAASLPRSAAAKPEHKLAATCVGNVSGCSIWLMKKRFAMSYVAISPMLTKAARCFQEKK